MDPGPARRARLASSALCVLCLADVAAAISSVAWLVRAIAAPGEAAPGLADDAPVALATLAIVATYVLAVVLGLAGVVMLRRPAARRWAWFVLGVLAALIGLPDVILVMLTGAALSLPGAVVLALLVPAATLVAVIAAISFTLTRPSRR